VLAVKESIINEEIVSGHNKDKGKESKEKDSTAFAATDHSNLSCHYCGIKRHIQPECRKKKRDEQRGKYHKGIKAPSPKGKGGKNKGSTKGKGNNKGKKGGNRNSVNNNWWTNDNMANDTGTNYSNNKGQHQSWNSYGKGQQPWQGKGSRYPSNKGKGRGQGCSSGNFPSDYSGSYANIHQDNANLDTDSSSQSQRTDHSSQQWADEHNDFSFVLLDNDRFFR
jgi:hypothetical protein